MAIGTPADCGNAATSSAQTSLSVTLSSAIAAGSLILVEISNHNSGTVVPDSVTDSAGNTYTLISAANSSAVSATLAYCVNASALASGATVTANFPSSRNAAMRVRSVGGMATSSAFDVSAINASGSGTSASVGPTSATSQADELIYAVFAYQNSRTFTAGSGYTAGAQTESTTTIRGVVAEWKIVSTTGAQTPDGTWDTSATYAAVVATFKGATATAKSASDTGALSEASSLAASASASDSAAGSESSKAAPTRPHWPTRAAWRRCWQRPIAAPGATAPVLPISERWSQSPIARRSATRVAWQPARAAQTLLPRVTPAACWPAPAVPTPQPSARRRRLGSRVPRAARAVRSAASRSRSAARKVARLVSRALFPSL